MKEKTSIQKQEKTKPIKNKEDVQRNPDHCIDQDFPGFPNTLAQEEIINPKTKSEKKAAAIDENDGEK
ncbi:MAG TPA: hypothetical protein VFV68_13740 [Agriterribacter sp.]|nr:hypothetical protein [Agriterribacter sp.]